MVIQLWLVIYTVYTQAFVGEAGILEIDKVFFSDDFSGLATDLRREIQTMKNKLLVGTAKLLNFASEQRISCLGGCSLNSRSFPLRFRQLSLLGIMTGFRASDFPRD